MAGLFKWLFRFALLFAVLVGVLWLFGSREPVMTDRLFDPATLGNDLDAYLATNESGFDDITPGAEKRIVWAGAPGAQTDIALVYLHGFSATSEEIRPVPDRVAEALGANLYYARLMGHGRSGEAMATPKVAGWVHDLDEALAIADRIGDRTIVISVSTGATLATVGLANGRELDGIAMIAPNFRVANPAAQILTWPAARDWVPWFTGAERAFEPINDSHAKWWTTRYPTVALLPMGALVEAAYTANVGTVDTPALFMFADTDQVVDHVATREIAARWGGPTEIVAVEPGPDDDPFHHVIAGDILSPGLNDVTVETLVKWIDSL